MTDTMATVIAKKFIQRRDAKARQKDNGDYAPVADWNPDGTRGDLHPWKMSDIEDHLAGTQTFGHYLVDQSDQCKLFAFDIDLRVNKPENAQGPAFTGSYCVLPDLTNVTDDLTNEQYDAMVARYEMNPRVDWLNRAHPGRPWLKFQMRAAAAKLSRIIYEELEIPVATAYSGSKGLHVYGFTGSIPAKAAQEAAFMVLQLAGGWSAAQGNNFFQSTDQDPFTGMPNLSIEVFPKQTSLQGKDLGNLMRLPLGRNRKSPDTPFFLDERVGLYTIAPHPDPIALLESGNPWRD